MGLQDDLKLYESGVTGVSDLIADLQRAADRGEKIPEPYKERFNRFKEHGLIKA